MNDPTLPLTGLSSVRSKSVVARFDGGMLSSNGGVLALAEVEKRLRVGERLARCIDDPRCAGRARPSSPAVCAQLQLPLRSEDRALAEPGGRLVAPAEIHQRALQMMSHGFEVGPHDPPPFP